MKAKPGELVTCIDPDRYHGALEKGKQYRVAAVIENGSVRYGANESGYILEPYVDGLGRNWTFPYIWDFERFTVERYIVEAVNINATDDPLLITDTLTGNSKRLAVEGNGWIVLSKAQQYRSPTVQEVAAALMDPEEVE